MNVTFPRVTFNETINLLFIITKDKMSMANFKSVTSLKQIYDQKQDYIN